MLTFGLKRTKNFLPNLRKRLEELNKSSFEIGYFPSQGVHEPSGLTYSGLFAIQSFGSRSADIPARPILDLTFSTFHPLTGNIDVKRMLKKYLSGIDKKNPKISLEVIIDNISGDYVEKVRRGFGDTSKLKSNSTFTIERKGLDSPLIETGELKMNMSYVTSFNSVVVTP